MDLLYKPLVLALAGILLFTSVVACERIRMRRIDSLLFYPEDSTFRDALHGGSWGYLTTSFRDRFLFIGHNLEAGEYALVTYNGTATDNSLDFPYSRAVSYQTSGQATDYVMEIELDTASLIADGKLLPDCTDLIFLDGGELLERSVEGCGSADTRVFVLIPDLQLGEGELQMLYGSGVSMEFAEVSPYTMDEEFDSEDWLEYEESNANSECEIYAQDGYLYMHNHMWASPSSATDCGFRLPGEIEPGTVVEFRASLPGSGSVPQAASHWVGLFSSEDPSDTGITALIKQEDYNPYRRAIISCDTSCQETTSGVSNNFQDFRIEFGPDTVDYYVNGALVASHSHVGDSAYFGGWATWWTNYGGRSDEAITRIEWVRTRGPELVASYAVGPEEQGAFPVEDPSFESQAETIKCLGTGSPNRGGNMLIRGTLEDGDLWLVPAADVDCSAGEVVQWDTTNYLEGHPIRFKTVLSQTVKRIELCGGRRSHRWCDNMEWPD
jgi:hypothetical protein